MLLLTREAQRMFDQNKRFYTFLETKIREKKSQESLERIVWEAASNYYYISNEVEENYIKGLGYLGLISAIELRFNIDACPNQKDIPSQAVEGLLEGGFLRNKESTLNILCAVSSSLRLNIAATTAFYAHIIKEFGVDNKTNEHLHFLHLVTEANQIHNLMVTQKSTFAEAKKENDALRSLEKYSHKHCFFHRDARAKKLAKSCRDTISQVELLQSLETERNKLFSVSKIGNKDKAYVEALDQQIMRLR